jgi:hypothetical protein
VHLEGCWGLGGRTREGELDQDVDFESLLHATQGRDFSPGSSSASVRGETTVTPLIAIVAVDRATMWDL